jgi:membrane fusion protein (multidrug efflux system)
MFKIDFYQLLIVGTIILISACSDDGPPRKNNKGGSNVFPVRVVVISPSPISSTYDATGTFEPNEQVYLTAERAGRLERLSFEEGSIVGKNTPVAYIEDDEINSQINTLQVQLSNAKTNFNRAKKLKAIEAVSQEELDNLEFEINRISSQIDELEIIRSKSIIRTPFAGKLGFREISPGAYVSPGQNIVELVDFHPLKATFNIPEKYVAQVNERDTVLISVRNNEQIRVPITRISPRIDPASRAFTARALVDNPDGKILPGSFANIEVPVYNNPKALLVPAEAIIQKLGGEELFLVKDGKAKATKVEVGIRNENFVEVKEGIERGDSVIITGLLSLTNGVAVSPTVAEIKMQAE